MKPRFLKSLSEIGKDSWNQLLPNDYPFARYEFLDALERSGCVGGDTGWHPRHLIIEEKGIPIAAMPLYEKEHSYGEYVFDWQWADAFHRYGRQYFPKLITAIPFSPVTGSRLFVRDINRLEEVLSLIKNCLELISTNKGYSSWHLLFPEQQLQQLLEKQSGLMRREAIQFHWRNDSGNGQPYETFEDFLQCLRSSKRKQLKRERRKINEQGLQMVRKSGGDITPSDWQAFYACYQMTYLKRSGHGGYLNDKFFRLIADNLCDQVMMVLAYRDGNPIASALFFFDERRLYGRYWGALESHDCLHFEACYYQGIEFAIERGIGHFDPGTQGEHKLVRGFEPVKTCSYHWIADQDFAQAIDEFLKQEGHQQERYQKAAAEHLPFHRDSI